MATLTIADLDNGKRDLETVDAVANSPADTTTTRYGDSVLTLAGALRRLGYQAPVPYAPGLNVDSPLFTVSHEGVIYAPDPEIVPFVTGAWNPAQWRIEQDTNLRALIESDEGAPTVGYRPPGGDSSNVEESLDAVAVRSQYPSDSAFNASLPGRSAIDANVPAPSGSSTLGAVAHAALREAGNVLPAFLEQHLSGFFGRGMLTAETINVSSETSVSTKAKGASSVVLGDVSSLVTGGGLTILHADGRYHPYVIVGISGSTVSVSPPLRSATSFFTSRAERTWYNRAHPGKFYIRYLAQRVVYGKEAEEPMPSERVAFCDFTDAGPHAPDNVMMAVGGATIYYFDAANTGSSGTTGTPVRFGPYRAAYVDGLTVGAGMQTPQFVVGDRRDIMVDVPVWIVGSGRWSLQVIDEKNRVLASKTLTFTNAIITQRFRLKTGNSGRIFVRVESLDSFSNSSISFNRVDIYRTPIGGLLIPNARAKIVCFGDSWVAGDLGSTPEREPITTEISRLLPYATVINSGVGGNNITNLLDRFDTDVAVHNPDVVLVNVGTNDIYNPASGTLYPTATDFFNESVGRLISLIQSIGAKPILIGVPALAQSDAGVVLPVWTLNDRAKVYCREQSRWIAPRPPSYGGNTYQAYENGEMTASTIITVTTLAASTAAFKTWDFPRDFIVAPEVETTISEIASSNMHFVASGVPSASRVAVGAVTTGSGFAVKARVTARGRWKA